MSNNDFLQKQQQLMDTLLNQVNQQMTTLVEEQQKAISQDDKPDVPNKDIETMDNTLKNQATQLNNMMSTQVTDIINKKSQEINARIKQIAQQINK